MLRTFGKIKTITKDDPIFHPELSPRKLHLQGTYYIKEKITLAHPEKIHELKPGILEVTVTTDNTETYETLVKKTPQPGMTLFYIINYKLLCNDGSIYTWRVYTEENGGSYRINSRDTATQILTKNTIDKLIYTPQEMADRFLSKASLNWELEGKYITTPRISEYDTNISVSTGIANGDITFSTERIASLHIYGYHKLWNKFINNSAVYALNMDDGSALDNYRKANPSWLRDILQSYRSFNSQIILGEMVGPISEKKIPNQSLQDIIYSDTLMPGLTTWMMHGDYMLNKLHYNIGNSISDWEFEPTSSAFIRDSVKINRIVGNTYLQGHIDLNINRPAFDNTLPLDYRQGNNVYSTTNNTVMDPSDAYVYSTRIIRTPDTNLKYNPVISYASNHSTIFKSSNNTGRMDKYLIGNEDNYFLQRKQPSTAAVATGIMGAVAAPYRFPTGVIANDPFVEVPVVKEYDGKHMFSPGLLYFANRDIRIGGVLNEPVTKSELVFTRATNMYDNILGANESVLNTTVALTYAYLLGSKNVGNYRLYNFDYWWLHYGYSSKSIYRAPSNTITTTTNNEDILAKLRQNGRVEDIRLGPEFLMVMDKSEIPIGSPSRIFHLTPNDPSMALTYLKMEVNKNANRYKTGVDQNIAYSPAYASQSNFGTRITTRVNLPKNATLGIDKITAGFRPIQVKVGGVWRNITK